MFTKQINLSTVIHILGFLIMFLGGMLIFPLILSYIYTDGCHWGILYSILISVLIGALFYKFTKYNSELSIRDGFLIVTFGWLVKAFVGALVYYLTSAIPSFTDAFFESMSGFTTTGASILNNIEALPKSMLFWRAFTHWVGGMGIIVLSLAILPMLSIGGMQLFKAEVPGPTADKITPRVQQTAKILWVVYVGITLLETIILTFGGMPLFDSLCHSFATMATGGFSTQNLSIGSYNSPFFDYVITFFMFVAGVNFSLHYKFLIGKFNTYSKDYEFKTYLSITLIVAAIITFSNYFENIYSTVLESFQFAIFQSVALITTTGFGTADFEQWTPVAQILLFILMFIGGSAGSTGGGMKVVRIMVVLKQGLIELKKLVHPHAVIPLRFSGKILDKDIVYAILGFFVLYIILFVIVALSMTFLEMDLISALGASASCLGNIGPGLGSVGPAHNYANVHPVGKWILSIAMLVGRLEIYTVIVIFTKNFWKK